MAVKMSVAFFEKNRNLIAISTAIALITSILLIYTNILYVILYTFLTGCILVTLSFLGFLIYCSEKKPYEKTDQILTKEYEKKIQSLHGLIVDSHKIKGVQNEALLHLPIIYGRTIDSILEQLIDNILRDFLIVYLKAIDLETDALNVNLREDFWNALVHLNKRVGRIDSTKLIAQDVVTKVTVHFEKMRIAQNRASDSNFVPVFFVLPHLKDVKSETDHLRKIANMCVRYLLPKDYYRTPLKLFLREVLATKVFFPAISLLTNPDYINKKIIAYLESRRHEKALRQKTFEYAANFEDFIKIINSTTDDKELRRYRNHIVNEIMEATAMQNQQRSKGLDPDAEKSNSSQSKSDINAAKKLKQYISQLSLAKSQCEKVLEKLGFDTEFHIDEDDKIYSLSSILETVCGRKHFSMFLETVNSSGLLGFYMAVEELRSSPKSSWHQLGVEIYYTYIRSPSVEIKIDKEMRKRIDAFVLGNSGPDVLYDLQSTVLATLKEKYYPPFLLSLQYCQFKKAMQRDLIVDSPSSVEVSKEEDVDDQNTASQEIMECIHEGIVRLGDHSNYARMKLDQLQEKLDNKTQALQALRSSIKPESKVLSILENEVEWLKSERRQLEAHLARTELWGENLGKWRATVQNAEVPDERSPPQFVLVVHVNEKSPSNDFELIEKPSESITPTDKREEAETHSNLAPFMTAREFLSSRDFITSCVSLISRDKNETTNKTEVITPTDPNDKDVGGDKDKSENVSDKDKFSESEDINKAKRDPATSREIRKRRGERKRIDSAYEATGIISDFGSSGDDGCSSNDVTDSQKASRHEESRGDISTGWVVLRSLTEFQELNRKLRPLSADLKYVELPSSNTFKSLFGKTDKTMLDKAKNQIQKYLEFVLTSEHLYQSESLYTFLSPSSEHLKIRDTTSPKKSKFSITTLLKSAGVNTDNLGSTFGDKTSGSGPSGMSGLDYDQQTEMSHYLNSCDDAAGSNTNNLSSGATNSNINLNFLSMMNNGSSNSLTSDGEKDSIAEPLFTLMSEIFDMKGVFMWLRRSLISFVQVTYGSTINRQIRDMIAYLHSESMLHYYLSSFIKSWWPGGELRLSDDTNSTHKDVHNASSSTNEENSISSTSSTEGMIVNKTNSPEDRRIIAQTLLLENIPQILVNLLGQRTAKRGVSKIFEILQDERANKQLFYEILELVIVELFPEIQKQRKIYVSQQEHV